MKYLQTIKESNKVKIDLKDKKILHLLSINSRIPLTQLKKKVGLSRDAVDYRIKNYEKAGLIQGYRTMVDISKFGYQNYHMLIKLNNPSFESEKILLDNLMKYPCVRAIIKFNGNFDYEVALIAKDILELDEITTNILNDCCNLMQYYEILTISKLYAAETFPKSFIDFKVEGENALIVRSPSNKGKNATDVKIDEKDIEILKIISEKALMPLSNIAGKVKLSADAVAYRINNMISSGVIIKFLPIINYNALDYSLHALLLNTTALSKEKEKELRHFFETEKSVLWAVKTIGRYNVFVYLLVRNIDEVQETVFKLRRLFPNQINSYENLIAYEEYKYVYFPSSLF